MRTGFRIRSAQTVRSCAVTNTWTFPECNHNYAYCIVKQLASVARQTGKKHLMSELNGCTGWQMRFSDYKGIGDWQAIIGINLRCPHLSWYTMQGEAKRDYPASIPHGIKHIRILKTIIPESVKLRERRTEFAGQPL